MKSAINAHDEEQWRANARCEGVGFSLFYPEDEDGNPISNFKVNEEEGNPGFFCVPCPVRKDCLEYSIKHKIYDGIFGGYNEDERKKMISTTIKIRRQESRKRRHERKQKLN